MAFLGNEYIRTKPIVGFQVTEQGKNLGCEIS